MREFDDLKRLLSEGRIDRREFIKRSSALGLAAFVPSLILSEEALAAAPKQGGFFRQAVPGGATTDSLEGGTLVGVHNVITSWSVRNNLTEVNAAGEIVGELAESWEASAGATSWVFNLRKGVEFHNGKTLDAQDVVHSFQSHLGEASKSGAKGLMSQVKEIKADGKDKIIFKLAGGNADFPYILADYHLTIVPNGTTGDDWNKGMGTGPYILTGWEPGVRSSGKRNPNYFKEGMPYFDEIETLNVADVNARSTALRNGEIHAMDAPDPNTLHLLKRESGINIHEVAGTKHFSYPMLTDQSPYDNNHVRLALKYSIDREAFLQKVLGGHGQLGNDHPIGPNQRYFAKDLEQRMYDPDRAKFHLKKTGLSSLDIKLHSGDIYSGGVDGAMLYQNAAAGAGINMDVVREPTDGYWSNVWRTKPFSVCYWSGRITEDWMFSIAYAAEAAWNDSHWKHKKFNSILVAARSELDDNKRRSMYAEMQSICRDEGGVVIPAFANWILATSSKIGTPKSIASNWSMDGEKSTERWWFA
jgi:peptide/nickel transport system substrate-binding protein